MFEEKVQILFCQSNENKDRKQQNQKAIEYFAPKGTFVKNPFDQNAL